KDTSPRPTTSPLPKRSTLPNSSQTRTGRPRYSIRKIAIALPMRRNAGPAKRQRQRPLNPRTRLRFLKQPRPNAEQYRTKGELTMAEKKPSTTGPGKAGGSVEGQAASGGSARKPWVKKTPVEVVLEQIAKQEQRVAGMREELK